MILSILSNQSTLCTLVLPKKTNRVSGPISHVLEKSAQDISDDTAVTPARGTAPNIMRGVSIFRGENPLAVRLLSVGKDRRSPKFFFTHPKETDMKLTAHDGTIAATFHSELLLTSDRDCILKDISTASSLLLDLDTYDGNAKGAADLLHRVIADLSSAALALSDASSPNTEEASHE